MEDLYERRLMVFPFKFVELRDELAVRELRRLKPEAIRMMVEQCQQAPHYDDKECIALLELFCDGPEAGYALFFYIEGNRDEKDNGWILRYFSGISYNSDEHISILKAIQSQVGIMIPMDTV